MAHGLKKAVDFYLDKGWNIIPCDFKKAVFKDGKIEKQVVFPPSYKVYHTERVTKELATKWWGDHNGIAIVTGKISGITVIDIDTKLLPEIVDMPQTFTVETNKGFHFYFKYFEPIKTGAQEYGKDGFVFNMDIRNDGGIAFADPSEYELPDGTKTRYKINDTSELAEFPLEWCKKIYAKYGKTVPVKDWKAKVQEPIDSGSRNATFTSIIGGLLQKFPQDDWNSIVWTLVQSENHVQKKPLTDSELRSIFDSISKAELQKRNMGGEIKDISITSNEEQIDIEIRLEKATVCCRTKNIVAQEGDGYVWLKKSAGLSHSIDYHFKLHSDTSKDNWAKLLKNTFDRKEDKEVYPWTLIVSKICLEIDRITRDHKQDFHSSEAVAKQVSWMLEPFIQEDQVNTFYGMGSSGKTTMAMYFGAVTGEEKNINVLLIDYENDINGWKDKLNKMGVGQEHLVYFDSEQIPLAEQVEKIKEVIKRRDIKLIIVDSASMASGESTSDEKAAIRMIAGIKILKTTTILIAHQRKNDGDRTPIGSIQYENQSRNVWQFASTPDNLENGVLHIACKHTKANNTYLRKNPIGFKIAFQNDKIEITNEDAKDNFGEKFSIKSRIEHLLEDEGNMLAKDIANVLGITLGTTQKNLSEGSKKGGKFTKVGGGLWGLTGT